VKEDNNKLSDTSRREKKTRAFLITMEVRAFDFIKKV
jgi:hypothetical protein